MAIVRMVRHGEAAAGYSEHPDPGLSERGRSQADRVASRLRDLGPLVVVSSPMARARETASPLAAAWNVPVLLDRAVSEIPSPALSPPERGRWLQRVMAGTWSQASDSIRRWRDDVVASLLDHEGDVVVFSHFVAINAAISVATAAPGPHCAQLDHCSITTFDTGDGTLRLVEAGAEGPTIVL